MLEQSIISYVFGMPELAKNLAPVVRAHYLDDYITVGPPGSTICQRNLDTLLESAITLGIPIAEHKTVGPATKLTFLGIEINTVSGNSSPLRSREYTHHRPSSANAW